MSEFGQFQNEVWALINSIVMNVLLYDDVLHIDYPSWRDEHGTYITDLAIGAVETMFPEIYNHVIDEGTKYSNTVGFWLNRHASWMYAMEATYYD